MKRRTEEHRLVLLAQTGDRAAFDGLLRALQGDLQRYLQQQCGDGHAADDLLQEVFLSIYRKLRWLRDPDLVRPWAYRIAHRAALRRARRRGREREHVRELDGDIEGPPPPDHETDRKHLQEWMSELSPLCRGVVHQHYFERTPLRAVAAALGVPLGTVKSRLAYGLQRLRRAARHSRSQEATNHARPTQDR